MNPLTGHGDARFHQSTKLLDNRNNEMYIEDSPEVIRHKNEARLNSLEKSYEASLRDELRNFKPKA